MGVFFGQCDSVIEAGFGVGIVERVFRIRELFKEFKWREEAGRLAVFGGLWYKFCRGSNSTKGLFDFLCMVIDRRGFRCMWYT